MREKKIRLGGRGNSEEDEGEKRERAEYRICKLSNKVIAGSRCKLRDTETGDSARLPAQLGDGD
jgi:hypothetical protein